MKKVRFCYIPIVVFATWFKLALAVFPHSYYVRFNLIGKWNYKDLVYVKIIVILVASYYVIVMSCYNQMWLHGLMQNVRQFETIIIS